MARIGCPKDTEFSLDCGKRLIKVGDQIVLVLNADREPDSPFVDPHGLAHFFADRAMRGGRRVRRQRLNTAQGFRVEEDLDRLQEPCRFLARLELKLIIDPKPFCCFTARSYCG